MTRQEWIKYRNDKSVNMSIIKKCCELDPKCKLTDDEIDHSINILQKYRLFKRVLTKSYVNYMIPLLDNHFNLLIVIDKNNKEIKII